MEDGEGCKDDCNWEDDDGDGDGDGDQEDEEGEVESADSAENSEHNYPISDNTTNNAKKELLALLRSHGEDNLFPPLDGTAFYLLTCKINHSCEPNVCIYYECDEMNGLQAKMVALKDIIAGEELVQSYIDQSRSKSQRQSDLAEYGFTCSCHKCKSGI